MSGRDQAIINACVQSIRKLGMAADPDAFREALAAAGYAVVPVEPTREMTLAANKRVAVITPDGTWALGRDEAARTWTAMLAAAGETKE